MHGWEVKTALEHTEVKKLFYFLMIFVLCGFFMGIVVVRERGEKTPRKGQRAGAN